MPSPLSPLQSGLTALHLAAQEDKVNVADILVRHGADQDAHTKVQAPVAAVVGPALVTPSHPIGALTSLSLLPQCRASCSQNKSGWREEQRSQC